jgi:mRNA-degrading endonuclease toxin of MazEF toxin-antitoxin module
MVISRFEVYLVNLDPTLGHEIKKTRPCVVVSPDEMNRHIRTVIVAPMMTKGTLSHEDSLQVPGQIRPDCIGPTEDRGLGSPGEEAGKNQPKNGDGSPGNPAGNVCRVKADPDRVETVA